MKKRKLLSLAIVPALMAGALAGCSESSTSAEDPTGTVAEEATSSAPTEVPVDREYEGEIPEIGGEWGKSVTFNPTDAAEPDTVVARTLIEGDGEEIKPEDVVAAHYHGTLWDGSVFDSTFENAPKGKNSEPLVFSLDQVIQGWKYGLSNQRVGDRVELVIPSQYGYGEAGAGDRIPGGATLVFVVDLVGKLDLTDVSVLSEAEETSEKVPAGVSIEGPLGAKPTVAFDHDAKAPEEAVAIVLAEGKGRKITETDVVSYHYTFAPWGQDDQSGSTWDSGAAEYTPQAVGKLTGLYGMNVGSRVLTIHPAPDDPAGAVLFVLDITGAMDVAPVN